MKFIYGFHGISKNKKLNEKEKELWADYLVLTELAE